MENLLKLKISDFGSASPLRESMRSLAGTPTHMAPEMIRKMPYSKEVDIFSLVIVIWETIYRRLGIWKGERRDNGFRRPYEVAGNIHVVMFNVANQNAKRPKDFNPDHWETHRDLQKFMER